jgi:hypothetical protein
VRCHQASGRVRREREWGPGPWRSATKQAGACVARGSECAGRGAAWSVQAMALSRAGGADGVDAGPAAAGPAAGPLGLAAAGWGSGLANPARRGGRPLDIAGVASLAAALFARERAGAGGAPILRPTLQRARCGGGGAPLERPRHGMRHGVGCRRFEPP